jgi:hypothetical protein
MPVTLDPPKRRCHPIEPQPETVVELGRATPFEPRRHRIGEDRRLRRAGFGGERFEPCAERIGQEQLMADAGRHRQKSSCRSSGRFDAESMP